MAFFVATYPPLGQVTQLQSSKGTFHSVLEVSPELATEPWEVVLWHSQSEGVVWTESPFSPAPVNSFPEELDVGRPTTTRLFFTLELPVSTPLTFTIKYRQGATHEWFWVRDELGLDDGVVLPGLNQFQANGTQDLPDLIQDLNPDLKWRSHPSQTPATYLWSIEAKIAAARDESACLDLPLGKPWGHYIRWFALVRPWAPWLAPRHGSSSIILDRDALLCSFLSLQGKHLVFLGVGGVNHVTTLFRSGEGGRLVIHIRNDNPEPSTGTILVALGDSFENALAAVMYHARSMVSAEGVLPTKTAEDVLVDGVVQPEWYERWYDGLGYCTWNSLGQRLTEEKVMNAIDTLAKNKIQISHVIIDDNWQDIEYKQSQWDSGWKDFEAEPKAFPRGLKRLVSDIRSKHKSIQHVAVWHTIVGYWGGISPNGQLARRYKTVHVSCDYKDSSQKPVHQDMILISKEDVKRFYDDFYRFLSSCNINGVKTDGQYLLDTLVSPTHRRDLIKSYLDAWTSSHLRHLNGNVISCMSLAPPITFHSQLPVNRPTFVCRNSDDYFPSDASSHPWHVWANAHVSLFSHHLNVLPDWDMFQTKPPTDEDVDYSAFHAAARCVSGGPIYITDVPGRHDLKLIQQMTGVTPRGKTVIFRPSVPGRSLDVYVGYDDRNSATATLLKVGAYHGRAAPHGIGIIGVFNVTERPGNVTEVLPLNKFHGVVATLNKDGPPLKYVVRSHVSGKVTKPMAVDDGPSAGVVVSLEARGWDVLSAYPLLTVTPSKGTEEVSLANLGLLGKITGCAAVLGTSVKALENGRILINATVKALGVLGIYISILPRLSIENDFLITIQGQTIPVRTVSVSKQNQHVLEIDVETAWKEMKLDSGWANELTVKVYFSARN